MKPKTQNRIVFWLFIAVMTSVGWYLGELIQHIRGVK